jgi:hypothetical protein
MTVLVQLFTSIASWTSPIAILHEEEIAVKVYADELSSTVDNNMQFSIQ